jgi:hypothetical protein
VRQENESGLWVSVNSTNDELVLEFDTAYWRHGGHTRHDVYAIVWPATRHIPMCTRIDNNDSRPVMT